ncbi:hypothetical protein DCAR_0519228 [Daucus carota subsp. sativus]|uniref:Uncharacterized protein n=1 Tax=Daucus carota subsp. sativus TaxID=79200 RepID=A0A164XTN3_DAUCS|nr:hypothetical protein DCAR_0519228 [Daucus carota subsp. sativus]
MCSWLPPVIAIWELTNKIKAEETTGNELKINGKSPFITEQKKCESTISNTRMAGK